MRHSAARLFQVYHRRKASDLHLVLQKLPTEGGTRHRGHTGLSLGIISAELLCRTFDSPSRE